MAASSTGSGLQLPSDEARQQASEARHGGDGGDGVIVRFKLPHGDEWISEFQPGQDVAYMKYVIQKEWGIPLSVMALALGEETLINPMSIADYDELMTGAAQVDVVIPPGEDYPEYTARLAERSAAGEGKAADGKDEGKSAQSESKH